MTKGRYEVVGRLPPGQGRKTSLAVMPGAFRRMAVLRPVGKAELISVANLHPQLPAPLGVEEVDGVSFAVYDFFPGATLQEIVQVYRAQEQLPPLGLVARIVADAARALHVAHEHQDPLGGPGGLVHGGLSTSSFLMGFDGEVRVLDFGLRKKNRFASPEAISGGPFTAKCDVFSLAAALHASVTAFEKDYAAVLSRAPSSAQFPPPSTVHPDASPELDSLLMRALFPDPASRLSSALELAEDLERIVGASLPAREACATRLKQLFEERLDGFRNLVPREAPAASSPPRPRNSRPSMPAAQPPPQAPPPPRKSGPRSPIPTGTQPEANPIGRRPTPGEVKAAFGGDDDVEEDKTIVADSDPALVKMARPTGEQKKVEPPPRPSADRKSGARKPPAPLPDVPWESGPLGAGIPTAEREAPQLRTEAVPAGGDLAIEDVPTGLSRRASGQHAAVGGGGSTAQEKARAVGQELVDTGEIEPVEAFDDPELDDLREQPTMVRTTGTQQKLKMEPAPEDIAAAFGDPDASGLDEPGTAIITSKDGPKAKAESAPVAQPLEAPDTGVLEHNKKKEPAAAPPASKPKKKGGPLRAVTLSMLVVIVGGFGFISVKNPALVRAKLDGAMIKWGLKKAPPPPPPEEPVEPVVAAAEPDAGPSELAPLPLPPADLDAGADDDADGGEEEDEDEDGGTVAASDAGSRADGGPVPHKVKKKKKKKRRGAKEWWQTQQ